MNDKVDKLLDDAVDLWEAVTHTQTDRTGHSAARVASALANNVDAEAIALQMTKNSKRNNPESPVVFTEADMHAYAKLHEANKTRSAFPKQQAGAMIRFQRESDVDGDLVPNT
ncbi:hypothetical protein [Burkholderia vietnamiensis]|uniref:hypothetical protein n=1 Tax=Burkholderia vietnamiensis TaxID=60552 RepID=UPI00158BD09A|nr:hypothetical protein [Burkholderia vietnamiensis]